MVVPYHRFWEIQRKSGVISRVVGPITGGISAQTRMATGFIRCGGL
jgi:hypothetical protein